MRAALLMLTATLGAAAQQPKIDNVLVRMVPAGSTALVGAQLQAMISTPLYRRLVDQQAAAMLDRFTAETGFDPRKDVRELLYANTPEGALVVARGNFKPGKPFDQAIQTRHGVYVVWTMNDNGLCILDNTLAAAGKLRAVTAAVDEWEQKGKSAAAQPLLSRLKLNDPHAQFWAVTMGVSDLLSGARLPGAGAGLDLGPLFRGLTDIWLEASFASGFKFNAHGNAASLKDAQSLRDTFKGAIGFGRLSVPEDHPELLPVFDGMEVDQQDRAVAIRIDLSQKSIEPLIDLLNRTRK